MLPLIHESSTTLVGASVAALYLPSRDDPNRLTTAAPSRPFPTAVLYHSLTLLSAPLSSPLLLYPQRTSVALLSANLRRSPALAGAWPFWGPRENPEDGQRFSASDVKHE